MQKKEKAKKEYTKKTKGFLVSQKPLVSQDSKAGCLAAAVLALAVLALIVSGCFNKPLVPSIELSTASLDLGDINPEEGKMTETIFVKNTGSAPLEIYSVSTSCGCTEAEIESTKILPGQQTKLTVTYDPTIHPGLTGSIKRVVYIKSNDPFNEEVELEIAGNQLAAMGQ